MRWTIRNSGYRSWSRFRKTGTLDPGLQSNRHQNVSDRSLGHAPLLQRIRQNPLRYAAKCQFTPYLLMVKNPENDPGFRTESGSLRKSNRLVLGPRPTPPKHHRNPFINVWRRYLANRKWLHTHGHTHTVALHIQPRSCQKRGLIIITFAAA